MHAKQTLGMTTWRAYVHIHRLAERTLLAMLQAKLHSALNAWRGTSGWVVGLEDYVKLGDWAADLVRGRCVRRLIFT